MENRALQAAASASAALAALGSRVAAQLQGAPSAEGSVKLAGGVVAALLAAKYAGSLKAAVVVGLLSGLFAHSLYADVLAKRRGRRTRALPPARRRGNGRPGRDEDAAER